MSSILNPLRRSFAIYRGLPRAVYVLFVAQVVNSLGHFVLPFLTLILTERGGLNAAEAGRIVTIATASFVPGSIIGGRIADTFGRKRVVVGGFAIGIAAFVAWGMSGNVAILPWFIFAAEFSSGLIHPTLRALTADITTPENRKAAYSLTYLGHNIGFSVGPLLAGLLFRRDLRVLFWGDAATSIVAMVLIVAFIRETRPDRAEVARVGREQPREAAETGGVLAVLLRRPIVLAFMLTNVLMTLVYSQYTFGLPLQMNAILGDAGPVMYGVVMTTNALVVVFCTAPIIAATKRLRPILCLALAAGLYLVGMGSIYFVASAAMFVVTALVWTAGEILSATNVDVYVADHTPVGHRGRMNALVPIIAGAGFALGPLLIGTFIERFSVRDVWPLTAILSASAAVIFILLAALDRAAVRSREASGTDRLGVRR